MLTLEEIFPPFALRIAGGGVELRVLRDDDLPALVELVRDGVQAPGTAMPFLRAWHQEPFAPGDPDGFPTSSLAFWWAQRAVFAPDGWRLAFTVRRDGRVVGMQGLFADDFRLTREVRTGSWLGLAHQGRGTGTLMRQLVVAFAFDELGADVCGSGYLAGNDASAEVSRKVGYVADGRPARIVQRTSEGPSGVLEQRVVVTPVTFVRPGCEIEVEGAEAVRHFLGIERPTPST